MAKKFLSGISNVGTLVSSPSVVTSGTQVALLVSGVADTNQTASVEKVDVEFALNRVVQFATGGLATQRAVLLRAPTYSFVGASVITDAATLSVTGAPIAGANATLNNRAALWVMQDALVLGTRSAQSGLLVWNNISNGNTITWQSGATSASYTLTLPTAQGSANSIISNNGSGVLSWLTGGAMGTQVWAAATAQAVRTLLQVEPVGKTLVYTGTQLTSMSDAYGTKTFTYNGSGQLTAVTGTGAYRSKTFTYTGVQLTSVTVT